MLIHIATFDYQNYIYGAIRYVMNAAARDEANGELPPSWWVEYVGAENAPDHASFIRGMDDFNSGRFADPDL